MEHYRQDKGLAEESASTSTPTSGKTEVKEKDVLIKLKELLTPVNEKNKEWKTASTGIRG